MIRIKFYTHLIFPETKDTGDMFRSVDIVVHTVECVAKVFKGKSIYVGTGAEIVQYDDVVEFENLSEVHLNAILTSFHFARKL